MFNVLTEKISFLNDSISDYITLNSESTNFSENLDVNDIASLMNNLDVLKCTKEDLNIIEKAYEIEQTIHEIDSFFRSLESVQHNFNALANYYYSLRLNSDPIVEFPDGKEGAEDLQSVQQTAEELGVKYIEKNYIDKIDSEVYGAEYLKGK